MKFLKYLADRICKNKIIAIVLTFLFLIPLVLTILQYISSGFILKSSGVSLLYWPGSKKSFTIILPVFISFGIMGLSYLYGIYYLNKRNIFLKVLLITILSVVLGRVGISIFSNIFNIHEMQSMDSMDLKGIVDRAIFSQWYNPLWEEMFFTGIPLLIYKALYNKLDDKMKKVLLILYYTIPSIIMCIYHVPNHGYIRIVDTFIIHIFSQYIATNFGLISTIVTHYFMDAVSVISFSKIANIDHNELKFLFENQNTIDTVFLVSLLLLLISVVFFILKYSFNYYKSSKIERKNMEI